MKSISTAVFFMLLAIVRPASGDVLQVNIWQPMPGKAATTIQNAQTARAIHTQAGANVVVGSDQMGRVHYGIGLPSWEAWGQFRAKMAADAEWSAFVEKLGKNPSAVLEDVYMLDQPAGGAIKSVYHVSIWEPLPGQGAATLKTAMGAKPIHEKLGATIGINVDEYGRLHYVASFDSWAAWGKFQADEAASKEWNDYIAGFIAKPSATLKKVYLADQIPPN